jgi:transposase
MDAVPLCQGCSELKARIAELEARLQEQARLILDLASKLQNKDLPRSGTPPAPAKTEKTKKKPSGRKPGGQPGHPPHMKQLAPAEKVSETIPLLPDRCEHCATPLPEQPGPNDPAPTRFQVAELPELKAKITEYQGHARTCPCCNKVTQAVIPADLRANSIGPGLAALMAYLVGVAGLSKRRVEELIEAIFEVPVSVGTISNLEQATSAALEPAYQQASDAARSADIKHLDETGWKKAGHKRWLWVVATQKVVMFLIHRLRNAAVVVTLLGAELHGILCTDRWKAYNGIPLAQRQVCWAHLRRNFEAMLKRGGRAKKIAQACLNIHHRLFHEWHLFRGGGMTRQELQGRLQPLREELATILKEGQRSRSKKNARFCTALSNIEPALWTFVGTEGVEPTNNHAERVQRLAVLYRKNCFGCHCDLGCRFVERLLTVVQTLRLQKRSVFQFLKETLTAHRAGQSGPQLVMER